MLTERFNKQRKSELDTIFSKKNISNVWRNIVKDQLRRIDLQDIFDYYDFNYNIDERALLLRNDLLNGNYQCSLPMIFRIEKKFGICRHIVIPQPIDALVLQVITETIRPEILTYIIHSGFISGYQNRYGDNLKPPTNVYHRMTA